MKIHYSLQKSKQFVFIYTDCTESRPYLITRNNLIQINLLVKKDNYIHAICDGTRRNSDVMGESRNILVMCSITLMSFSIMPVQYSDEIEMWLNSL